MSISYSFFPCILSSIVTDLPSENHGGSFQFDFFVFRHMFQLVVFYFYFCQIDLLVKLILGDN